MSNYPAFNYHNQHQSQATGGGAHNFFSNTNHNHNNNNLLVSTGTSGGGGPSPTSPFVNLSSPATTATGWPLPNADSKSLEELRTPMCVEWQLEVLHAIPSLAHLHPSSASAHQQHQGTRLPTPSFMASGQGSSGSSLGAPPRVMLVRGQACVHRATGEKGIYIGRPLQGARGNVAVCVMRDSQVNPPRAKLIEIDLQRAAGELLFLPDQICPFGCGYRIPADEIDAHRLLRHQQQQQQHSSSSSPNQNFGIMNYNNNGNSPSSNVSNNNTTNTNSNTAPFFSVPGAAGGSGVLGAAVNFFNSFGASPSQQQQQQIRQSPSSTIVAAPNAAVGAAAVSSPTAATAAATTTASGVRLAGDTDLMKCLQRIKKLGEGAQGIVWQCKVEPASRAPAINVDHGATPGYVVLKSIKCKDHRVALARFEQSDRLRQMKSAHLVPYFSVVYDPKDVDRGSPDEPNTASPLVHVIMPYYSSGSLMQKISQQRGKFTEQWLLSTLLQLSSALNILHGHKPQIVHGDVKPDNILMYGKTDQVLLMDLEASSVIPPGQTTVKADNEGTFEWRAPEAADGMVSTATDMWSLGVVAVCLAILPDFPSLKNPDSKNEELCLNHEAWTDSRLYYVVFDSVKARGYEARTAEIICSLLRKDPKDRPTTTVLNEVLTEHMEKLLLSGKF